MSTNAETTSDEWDKFPSFLIDTNYDLPHILPLKLRFKRIQNQQSQHDYVDPNDELNHDDPIPDTLFVMIPEATPANPIFQPVSIEELTVAQLDDGFSVKIRRRLNERVALAFGENKTGSYAVKNPMTKS